MKIFGLMIATLLITFVANGQDVFPIGAKWHYSERFAFSGDYLFMTMECTGDTVIEDLPCRILEKSKIQGCSNRPYKEYFHVNDSGEVFFYDNTIETFQKLFDFDANIGDSWTILLTLQEEIVDTVTYTVNSISKLNINGVVHNVFHTTNTYTYWHYGIGNLTYIENIGDVNYFFPWNIGYCDANYFNGLRCYEDDVLGFYSTEIVDSCNYVHYWTESDIVENNAGLKVYPNPAYNNVFLNLSVSISGHYKIYGINGNMALAGKFSGQEIEIDISGLADGVYFISIQNDSNTLYRARIIKCIAK